MARVSNFLGDDDGPFLVKVRDDDVPRALSREQTTQFASDSACSTSNDDDFILNFQVLSPDTDR